MDTDIKRLRQIGPNERRAIIRQALGHYRSVAVGGIYTLDKALDNVQLNSTLIKALKHCVATHPILSACLVKHETESPAFSRPRYLDLQNHIDVLSLKQFSESVDEQSIIKYTVAQANDIVFPPVDQVPSWKIVVQPLPANEKETNRYLIIFAYYHSHCDGKSGLAFHKTLLSGLRQVQLQECPYNDDPVMKTPNLPLLPALEQAGKLGVSWGYLLRPVLGAYLPAFLAKALNLRASATPEAKDQWRGRDKHFFDPANFHTGLDLISIPNSNVQAILHECRRYNVKFTGLLHQIIVRALSKELPFDKKAGCFVSQTAVDLRRHLNGLDDDSMAMCPTAYYELHPRIHIAPSSTCIADDKTDTDAFWAAARTTTDNLAKAASTLKNQPVALLAYLRKMYPWTRAQIGKRRECSYELSNILSFDPANHITEVNEKNRGNWNVGAMVFSQPANATSGCLNFSIVSRWQGDMTITVSWQLGALDVVDEQAFVERVCGYIEASLESLGKETK
jgi:hypothetical protein